MGGSAATVLKRAGLFRDYGSLETDLKRAGLFGGRAQELAALKSNVTDSSSTGREHGTGK